MKYTSISEIGLIRKDNQDYVAVVENDNALMAVVCDGIGGANAGSVASQMTVRLLKEAFIEKCAFMNIDDVRSWFALSIAEINRAVFHESLVVPDYKGMGTTLVCAIIMGEDVLGFNIGDSRLYALRNDMLTCLSHDQTYAYEMFLRNEISEEQVLSHPKRNILMNAVGIHETIDFEIIEVPQKWDTLMLSSDGLHGYVPHSKMEDVFKTKGLLSQRNQLLELGYRAGGFDNISIILIEADRYE